MTVLLTGFEPYGGRSFNPSEEIVRVLDGATIGGAFVVGRVLPVAYAGLAGRVEALLAEVRPWAVVSLGLHPGAPAIRLEAVAANRNDFRIPDNAGASRAGPISEGGPAALPSTLPLDVIRERLLAAGIPCHLSADAGGYLCNALLYRMLEACSRLRPAPPAGFVHLPYLPRQAAGLLGEAPAGGPPGEALLARAPSMGLELMVEAARLAIAATLEAGAPTG